MAEKTGTDAPRRLKFGQRTSSSSDSLSKLKTNTFTRRRTAPDLFTPTLASSAFEPQQEQPQPEQAQRQPRQMTPGRIPRSSSFFQSLNTFVSRDATANNNKESNNTELRAFRQPRKITHRFSQPPSFFNQSQQDDIEPLISKSKSKTHITQRALMQPILNPPLPRRSTMGNLTQKPSPQTPNFMRPTSSSAARQNSARAVSTNYALKKTATPNKPRSRPSGQIHPPTNFSLPSSSRLPKVTVQEGTTPPNSPKFGLSQTVQPGQSEQSERPKLGINSNLTFEELLRTITPEEELNVVSKEPPATEEASDEPAASESNSVPEYLQVCLVPPLFLIPFSSQLFSLNFCPLHPNFLSSHN